MTERQKGYLALALFLGALVLGAAILAQAHHPSPSRHPVPTATGEIA